MVGSNTPAATTLKPASRPSTSARLDVVRHGGSAAAAVAAEAEGGSRGPEEGRGGREWNGLGLGGWAEQKGWCRAPGGQELTWSLPGLTCWRPRGQKW